MKKITGGFLVGVGAVILWYFRGKIFGTTYRRPIVLREKGGRCGIEEEPAEVILHRRLDDKIQWEFSNPSSTGCEGRRTVCIGNWRRDGAPTDVAPVTNQQGLCRPVSPGNPPIPVLARINANAPNGTYEYDILVDNVVVHDPIVKLIV